MRTITATLLLLSSALFAQKLEPGFDKTEFINTLKLSAYQLDTPWVDMVFALPDGYTLHYRSEVVGLENRFDIWHNTTSSTAVLNVRGSTGTRQSWVENFYMAMVPAIGSLQLNDSTSFEYTLASNPRAAVHTGWLLGLAHLAPSIKEQLLTTKKMGITNIYISGHSQGGGIAFLLTAYLRNLQENGEIPTDIIFKTYCSAGPKPGNLYFAYDYEYATRGGWSYNVVSSLDWVPETPFTVQTIDDFNATNPFSDAKQSIKKLKFPVDLVVKHIFKKLNKPTQKAQDNFQKYLGDKAATLIIKKDLPQFQQPEYFESVNYMRCGSQIVLMPDEEYHSQYPDSKEDRFVHHRPQPYLMLAEKMDGYQ